MSVIIQYLFGSSGSSAAPSCPEGLESLVQAVRDGRAKIESNYYGYKIHFGGPRFSNSDGYTSGKIVLSGEGTDDISFQRPYFGDEVAHITVSRRTVKIPMNPKKIAQALEYIKFANSEK